MYTILYGMATSNVPYNVKLKELAKSLHRHTCMVTIQWSLVVTICSVARRLYVCCASVLYLCIYIVCGGLFRSFSSRWIRLLFGREFPLPSVLEMWDALFADGPSLGLMDYIFVAMLMHIREVCKLTAVIVT